MKKIYIYFTSNEMNQNYKPVVTSQPAKNNEFLTDSVTLLDQKSWTKIPWSTKKS